MKLSIPVVGISRTLTSWPIGVAAIVSLALTMRAHVVVHAAGAKPPPTLEQTGLYSDFSTLQIDPRRLAFAPQYPLWTDGAKKRRWIWLPPNSAIDGSDPDAWKFPVGTRFWKEFSFNGQRIETRYMELQGDGEWLYAAYEWSPDGREATLTSEKGKRGAYALGDRRSHTIPSVTDCKVCHQGGSTEVLGFSTLQLSPDRDHGALHAESTPPPGVDLGYLVRHGLLTDFPGPLQEAPPRIAGTATERAALGYLHGNCGHCHNDVGSLKNIGLFLRDVSGGHNRLAITSMVGQPVKKPAPGQSPDAALRIDPSNPSGSALLERISSRYPALQMPPLGTVLVDTDAVALISEWIAQLSEPGENVRQGEKENKP